MVFSLRANRSLRIALLATGMLTSPAVVLCHAQQPAAASPALPSGLQPVSRVTVGGAQLALDGNGGLFRQDHPGKSWHAVHTQWQGKAVELLGIPALTEAPGSGKAPRDEAQQETYAAVLLRSTSTLHWVSVDRGKTWTPSTLDDVRAGDIKWNENSSVSYLSNPSR